MILTIAKAIYHSMSNKFKGYYLLWVLLNLIIWIVNGAEGIADNPYIYPFAYNWFIGTNVYDKSELIIYSIAPIVLFAMRWLYLNGKYANSLMGISLRDWRYSQYFLLWLFMHFSIWLLSGGETRLGDRDFYPFTNDGLSDIQYTYDISELLLYTITPLLIYLAIKFIRKGNK